MKIIGIDPGLSGGIAILDDLKIFDIYEGDNIPSGKKSIALNVTIQSSEKTLNENDLEMINNKIINF